MVISVVTVKLPPNRQHDPRNKKIGPCLTTGVCTDQTGAHHSFAVKGRITREEVQERFGFQHVTRIETSRLIGG